MFAVFGYRGINGIIFYAVQPPLGIAPIYRRGYIAADAEQFFNAALVYKISAGCAYAFVESYQPPPVRQVAQYAVNLVSFARR